MSYEELERIQARWAQEEEEDEEDQEQDEHRGRTAMMRRSPTDQAAVGKAMAARGSEVAYIVSAASSNFITAVLVTKDDTKRLDADSLRVETATEGETYLAEFDRARSPMDRRQVAC